MNCIWAAMWAAVVYTNALLVTLTWSKQQHDYDYRRKMTL